MIEVEIYKHDDQIKKIIIEGHAYFAEPGQDIVCSAVSAVTFGAINAIDELTDAHFDLSVTEEQTGYIFYENKDNNIEAQLLLQGLVISLQTIEESSSNYIKIFFTSEVD